MDATNQLISLILAAVISGGALAYLLDDIPAWKAWKPTVAWLKPGATFLLTAAVIFAITLLGQYAPALFKLLPLEFQIAIGTAAGYVATQLFHQQDKHSGD